MKQRVSILAVAMAMAALTGLAACSKPAPTTTTEEAAPAAAAPAAPAPAAEAAPAATPVALDIKDASGAAMTGDPVHGQQIFAQCRTCHEIAAGVNKIGPSLHGVVGRHTGSVEGFHYSDANKNANLTWTEQQLFDYLENPRKVVPGTTMAFVGLKDPQQRADVIAYLKQNSP